MRIVDCASGINEAEKKTRLCCIWDVNARLNLTLWKIYLRRFFAFGAAPEPDKQHEQQQQSKIIY